MRIYLTFLLLLVNTANYLYAQDYTVTTRNELISTLSIINDTSVDDVTIYIDGTIDMAGPQVALPIRKKVHIYGDDYRTSKIIFPIQVQFTVFSDGCKFSNLAIEGPHPNTTIPNWISPITGDLEPEPTTGGILVTGGNNLTIDSCEFKHFSYYGVKFLNSTGNLVTNSWLHDNKKDGLGYGLLLEGASFVKATHNLMELNRHCIAGSGEEGQGYIAQYNVFGEPGNNNASRLDMHGEGEVTGGEFMDISHNKFTSTNGVDIGIRGIPTDKILVYSNTFAHKSEKDAVTQQQNSFRFGRLGFINMIVKNNYYNYKACKNLNFNEQFLVIDTLGTAYKMKFNSDCYNRTFSKKIGNSFNIYDELYLFDWLRDGGEDVIARTNFNQYILFPSINDSFISSRGIRLSQELSNYNLLKIGNIRSTTTNLIGQKNDNNIYEIIINNDGTISETLLVTYNTKLDQMVLGKFNSSTLQSVLGYLDDGTSVVFLNNAGLLNTGIVLGVFPGHTLIASAPFIPNGFDHVVSKDNDYIYLWRWNSGVLLDGTPTIRSGNSGPIYKNLIPVNHNGKYKLCAFKNNGDVELLEFNSSFTNPISIGATFIDKVYKY